MQQANICLKEKEREDAVAPFYCGLYKSAGVHIHMFEASPFVVIFQYAFIAAFPLVGLVVVTKWVVDDWKKSRRAQKKA